MINNKNRYIAFIKQQIIMQSKQQFQKQFLKINIIQSSMKKIGKKSQGSKSKISATKTEQKYMKNLTEDLHRSNIAVEQITQHRKDEQLFSKYVDEAKNQLQSCIVQIYNEEKRQKVLKELISLMKGQMTKVQAKQMEQKQKQEQETNKVIKQLRDDIDKINHKKNQQIAKIAILKQSANQSRSERVVYSNLFKKLERQLKQSQQNYKNELLKAEKNKIQFQSSSVKKNKTVKTENCTNTAMSLSIQKFKMPDCYQVEVQNSQKQNKIVQTVKDTGTNSKNSHISRYQSIDEKKLQAPESQSQYLNSSVNAGNPISFSGVRSHRSTRIGRLNSSKQNIQNYSVVTEELTKFCERIKMATGCENFKQILELDSTIESENAKLQAEIEQVNEQIWGMQQKFRKSEGWKNQLIQIQDQYDDFLQENSKKGNKKHLHRNSFEMQCFIAQSRIHRLADKQNIQNLKQKSQKNKLINEQQFEFQVKLKQQIEKKTSPGNFNNPKLHIQQFIQLCNLLNMVSNKGSGKMITDDNCPNENYQRQFLAGSCIQLEDKCKKLDKKLSQLCYVLEQQQICNFRQNCSNLKKSYISETKQLTLTRKGGSKLSCEQRGQGVLADNYSRNQQY